MKGVKIDVSVSEMLKLREDGYSNKDIAQMLEISLPTVYKYIGKQCKHMESVYPQPTPKETVEEENRDVVRVISHVVSIDGFLFEVSNMARTITMSTADNQVLHFDREQIGRIARVLEVLMGYVGE